MRKIAFTNSIERSTHRDHDRIQIEVCSRALEHARAPAMKESATDGNLCQLIIRYGGATVAHRQLELGAAVRFCVVHEGGHQEPFAYECLTCEACPRGDEGCSVKITILRRKQNLIELLVNQTGAELAQRIRSSPLCNGTPATEPRALGCAMVYLFLAILAAWAGLSLLRLVHLYDRLSWSGRWRRHDVFRLIPVGAFFSPTAPRTEFAIVFRDLLEDGRVTAWTEAPRIHPRCWSHLLWNPQKHLYRIRTEWARSFLSTVAYLSTDGRSFPLRAVVSEPYLVILRYVTCLRRISAPRAIQFAVIEVDILTREVVCMLVSSAHDIE